MARIRTIKPEFPHSESMGRVSREARLCFVLIWTLCDDSGRTRGNSRILASLLYPYDDDAKNHIDSWLHELERENCIARYVVEDATYIEVVNWSEHQKIDKPTTSKLPKFEESSRLLAKPREGSRSLIGMEGTFKKEGNGSERDVELERSTVVGTDQVDLVFQHWRSTHQHPRAKLDDKRRRLISKALEHYSEADLCLAITGYRNSPHHMGQNDRATVYDAIELLLRDSAHIDAGLKFQAEPPRTDLSPLTRRNVAAVADWKPPELRNVAK